MPITNLHDEKNATFKTATDQTKGTAVKMNAQNQVVVCAAGSNEQGEAAVGIALADVDYSDGETVVGVCTHGFVKAVAGDTVTYAAYLKTDASGKLVPATNADDVVIAQAFESCSADEEFEVFVLPVPLTYQSLTLTLGEVHVFTISAGVIALGTAVKVSATNTVIAATSGTSDAGDVIVGIVAKASGASDTTILVKVDGNAEALIGTGGVTAGDYLKSAASGKLITADTSGDIVVGQAIDTISADAVGTIKMFGSPILFQNLP